MITYVCEYIKEYHSQWNCSFKMEEKIHVFQTANQFDINSQCINQSASTTNNPTSKQLIPKITFCCHQHQHPLFKIPQPPETFYYILIMNDDASGKNNTLIRVLCNRLVFGRVTTDDSFNEKKTQTPKLVYKSQEL